MPFTFIDKDNKGNIYFLRMGHLSIQRFLLIWLNMYYLPTLI